MSEILVRTRSQLTRTDIISHNKDSNSNNENHHVNYYSDDHIMTTMIMVMKQKNTMMINFRSNFNTQNPGIFFKISTDFFSDVIQSIKLIRYHWQPVKFGRKFVWLQSALCQQRVAIPKSEANTWRNTNITVTKKSTHSFHIMIVISLRSHFLVFNTWVVLVFKYL